MPSNRPQAATNARAVTFALACLAILAFAGNSVIARAALADGAIEAGAYSAIRLFSGALVLLPLLGTRPGKGDLPGAIALAVYVVGFSLAYLELGAGLGAIILFGFVQVSIIAIGLFRGERLSVSGWIGVAMALIGMIWVVNPGTSANGTLAASLLPVGLMATAGVAWGAYTLIGRTSAERPGGAVGSTARAFLIASLLVAPMPLLDSGIPSFNGVLLAVASGVVTSAMGYIIWYKVAPRLGLATVASVQLATPVVAAIGGVLLLSEILTWSLALGGLLILGGIALSTRSQNAD